MSFYEFARACAVFFLVSLVARATFGVSADDSFVIGLGVVFLLTQRQFVE